MSKIRRRFRCPKCGSLDIIRRGVRAGQQRYKSDNCGAVFSAHRDDVGLRNRFVWFRKWVLGKQTITDIARESGYSERQLRRWFDEYLSKAPEWVVQRRRGVHLLIDGTWFDRDHCLIVYRDNDSKSTLYYCFAAGEDEYEIIKDLQVFKRLGLSVSSFTTDGAEPIVRAIKYAYPHTTRQRCVVHIERECLAWLTQHPRTAAGITLRRLVSVICKIQTKNDKIYWMKELAKWYEEYEEFIKEKSVNKETGELTYTHDNIRRAYIHIHRALPDMFKFIDNPLVPPNTNGLESFFGHLKDNLRIHRGLSLEHRDYFVKWYLYFANEKKKAAR